MSSRSQYEHMSREELIRQCELLETRVDNEKMSHDIDLALGTLGSSLTPTEEEPEPFGCKHPLSVRGEFDLSTRELKLEGPKFKKPKKISFSLIPKHGFSIGIHTEE